MTDGQLLSEFAGTRSEESFAEIVRRHGRMVHDVCLRVTRSPELAEEAAQGAFLVLARKAGSVARKPCAGGWLHRVAEDVARNALRAEIRRRAREEEAAALRTRVGSFGEQDSPAALRGEVDAEIALLSEKHRQVVVGLYLEGHTQAGLAQSLGVPEGTVAWRSKEAIEMLRKRLARRGVTLGAVALISALAGSASTAEVPASFASLPSQAVAFATKAAAGTAGAVAWSLAEGAMRAMFMANVKYAAALLTAAVVVGMAIPLAYKAMAGDKPEAGDTEDATVANPSKPTLRRVDMPYAVLMTNCEEDGSDRLKELRRHLDNIQTGLLTLAGQVRAEHPEDCILYYCRSRSEYAQVMASVLGLEEILEEGNLLGEYVDGKPFRAFGSADTGVGSLGWGFVAYGIKRGWASAPQWLQYGIARIFVPSAFKIKNGRTIVDLSLLVAKRSLQQGDSFPLSDLFAERVSGMRKIRFFSHEEGTAEMRAEEICATALVRWLNARALLPAFYRGLRDGGTPKETLEKLCGIPLAAIEQQMLDWLKSYPEKDFLEATPIHGAEILQSPEEEF